jgi:lactate permease
VTALLAAIPVLVVVALMVLRRWSASRAGLVGATLALVIGVSVFGFGRDTPEGASTAGAFAGTFGEALFTSATILWIVLPALAIHHLQVATGATERLRVALAGLAADPRLLALLIGWFFALFVEGAAGFGASVALAAPFLVGVGYRPVDAVVVAMLGHAIGVSFGAIGTPVVVQVAATGLSGVEIAGATARLHLVVGAGLLVVMVLTASRSLQLPARGTIWGWTALAGAAFLVPYWALATFVGPELPTLGGALVGAAVFVLALRLAGGRGSGTDLSLAGLPPSVAVPFVERPAGQPSGGQSATARPPAGQPPAAQLPAAQPPTEQPSGAALLQAGAPYLVLIGSVLLTRLVPAIRDPLGAIQITWSVPGGFSGSFAPLTHPGTLLAVAFLGGALLQRVGWTAVRDALRTTVRQLGGVTIALVAMLSLARLMVHAGMTQALAEAAAAGAGDAWPLLAPMVGVLGTFVTGSATASNVLFTDLQVATADALDLAPLPMVGAQGYGAAVGNVVCPHNIVAAGATVGLTGAEGEVLRRTIGPALGYAVLGGLLTLLLLL